MKKPDDCATRTRENRFGDYRIRTRARTARKVADEPLWNSPERMAAIRAALDRYRRRGTLGEILLEISIAGRSPRPSNLAELLRIIREHHIEPTQQFMSTVPPEHQMPGRAQGPFPSRDPFLDLISRLATTPIEVADENAAVAARLLAITDVALALYRFKGKEWE